MLSDKRLFEIIDCRGPAKQNNSSTMNKMVICFEPESYL